MTAAFLLDLILTVLLFVAIAGGVLLHRRITTLKTQQTALDQAIREFGIATHQAHEAIHQLKTTSETAHQHFAAEAATAQQLKDDLGFLIARADKAASTLEQALHRQRQMPNQTPAPGKVKGTGPESLAPGTLAPETLTIDTARPIPRSRAEEDLLKVLKHRQSVQGA